MGLSIQQVARIVESIEALAAADFSRLSVGLRERLGIELFEVGGAVCCLARHLDFPLANRVVGLGIHQPATEGMVEAIVRRYKATGHAFMVPLSPSAEPAQIPDWLEKHGLKRGSTWVKMLRPAQAPVEPARTDLTVRLAARDQLAVAVEVMVRGSEIPDGPVADYFRGCMLQMRHPHTRVYLAYDGDMPVAAGLLLIKGDLAGCYAGATLPSHRGRGGQSALFERRIRDAAALGCRWIATETAAELPGQVNHSYRNMLRAGFQLAYARPNYLWRPLK